MAGLIKRLFGRDDPLGGVPSGWAAALDAVLMEAGRTPNVRTSLDAARAGRIRAYVVDDGPADVLATLWPDRLLHAFWTGSWSRQQRAAVRPLYDLFDRVPADVALRWARVLDAVHGPGRDAGPDRFPDGSWWPYRLAAHALAVADVSYGKDEALPALSMASMERLAVAAGWDPSAVVVAVVNRPKEWDSDTARAGRAFRGAADFPAALRRHAQAVRDVAGPGPIGIAGLPLAEALARADTADLEAEFADLLARLGASSAKTVRAETLPALLRSGPRTREALFRIARTGSAPQRQAALEALHHVARKNDPALLAEVAAVALADKAAAVRLLGEGWAAAAGLPGAAAETSATTDDAATAGAAAPQPSRPQVPAVDWRVPASPEVLAAVDALWARWTAAVDQLNRNRAGRPTGRPTDVDKDVFLHYLRSPQPHPVKARRESFRVGVDLAALLSAPASGPLGAVGVVKFVRMFVGAGDWVQHQVLPAARAATGHPTLLETVALLEPDGARPQHVLDEWCDDLFRRPEPPPEAVHEFFSCFVDLVDAAVSNGAGLSAGADRVRLYRGIATQPVIPASTVAALLPVALSGPKRERAAAQDALLGVPGLRDRVVAALSDGRADVRASAARWLARSGDDTVVPLLEKAFAKEKQDVARAALLDALELLGRDPAGYLGAGLLEQEAAKGLARGVPAALGWLDPADLPAVCRAGGEAVLPEVLLWLVVRAVKGKSPEPDAVLRRYCSLLDPTDREMLGRALLTAWIGQDLRPVDEATARSRAEGYARWAGPGSGPEHDQLVARYLPSALREPVGSAIDSKGVLAVAAACGGPWAAPVVARYLKDWYGQRAAQCRALLGMLAHIDEPSAVQVLLATSVRFRTKGIQDEALRLVGELAERRGWTVGELADRTVPTGGFDDDGVLPLDYGPRVFTARLRADLTVEVRSPEGAVLQALPDPRHGDDEAMAAEAKTVLSAARKDVKTVVAQQTARLHEAMCTGRLWSADDWQRHLAGHPVVRHLAQRLVWLEVTDDGATRAFRPLDDGTLTDADDEPVTLADAARVRLAHDALLAPDDVARWAAHLADYGVAPLFGQLGQGFWALPDDRARSGELREVEGHLVEAFALRGRATKLGWVRGAAEDGGIFTTYRKRFPSVGVDAVLEFTGNGLPEENRTVALLALWFARSGDDVTSYGTARLPLRDVPPVLLSECRREVGLVAAEGTGYDPDWERTTAW